MKIVSCLILLQFALLSFTYAQKLNKIAPVTLQKGNPSDSISFILTGFDIGLLTGKEVRYSSSLQIIDADKPWPPRWFVTTLVDSSNKKASKAEPPIVNGSTQGDKMLFYQSIPVNNGEQQGGHEIAYLICDTNLNAVDTFSPRQREVDPHDFKISPSGDKLYFIKKDTVLNITDVHGDPADTAVNITYQRIQITDAHGKLVFNWDPLLQLGPKATYAPYKLEKSVIQNQSNLGWSHGNALDWDKDGNILYSFKFIGIGKISRKDGHIIWRIDRNKLKPNALSDSLPLFLQHDFQPLYKLGDDELYSVLSNGDSLYPYCEAYQFTVHDSAGYGPIIRIKTKAVSSKRVASVGGGNYDIEPNGNYIYNYGISIGTDTFTPVTLFEYHGADNSLEGQYSVPPGFLCYRVHQFPSWRPRRPIVKQKNGVLTAENGLKEYTWYKLSGKSLTKVERVGTGQKFQPPGKGFYCVTVKYGLGAAVSEVVEVK